MARARSPRSPGRRSSERVVARPALAAAIAIAVGVGGAPARAEIRDGHALLRYCTATIGAYAMFCFGYIDSVIDDLHNSRNVDGYKACIPTELDDGQRRDIVVGFLRTNPAIRDLDATGIVARAFSEAFPCR